MLNRTTRFASRNWSIPVADLDLSLEPISGGLESRVVRAMFRSPLEKDLRPKSFVVKELRGLQRRETNIYRELWTRSTAPPTVRLLGVEATQDADYLYLEEATPQSEWPWNQTLTSAAVCRALAQLHDSEQLHPKTLIDWDYESDLAKSADETLAVALNARDEAGICHWRRIGDLRRVVAALPKLRSALLQSTAFIHGDVHSGNVILRASGKAEIAFIDWARARFGSPLEDLASWLHSLGCWEPEARRRHDTLLRAYFDARSSKQRITTELRTLYWYASASNGLSGAIRYHLSVLIDPGCFSDMKRDSARILRSWERVIRRVTEAVGDSSID
ncbi:MAG TPA: aminoglycoside phosphotransferase family protein [Pyrinomonadaceae bacterium]|nr:aminoglycoside phosphotransferase family protein [Pyrinomonadaceae bacterium]